MDDVTLRLATPDDLPAVAALRWAWLHENGGQAADVAYDEFVTHFVAWAKENTATHRCVVLRRGDAVIGMAWLALVQRVPTPTSLSRRSGDVQSVYVVPSERDSGLGGRLVDAVLELGRDLGMERITVHSTFRAISAYCRHGFAASPRLLQATF
ncbi:GNAT family N-acetyltransferase [Saccharomonospora azurea]|uniref:Acetyltransferase n=1 Tax=Saccharomonospora azurea NA-128 TaxID=882081 RepID=H8GF96_9PSEU|nr:GNAT family N-acetyltransferase [Saccharomonospora azurea]EHY88995.1 acetyltransferase [Saccharomonospora azurea NA-128]